MKKTIFEVKLGNIALQYRIFISFSMHTLNSQLIKYTYDRLTRTMKRFEKLNLSVQLS